MPLASPLPLRSLSVLLVMALAVAMPGLASAGTITCSGTTSAATCSDVDNNLVIVPGNSSAQITDLNDPTSGVVLGSTTLIGANNSIAATYSNNQILGYNNSATGILGNIDVTGSYNSIVSDESNISITGANNKIQGGDGYNLGITVNGGSNTLTDSSGAVDGSVNSITNTSLANVHGYFNVVSDSQDVSVNGDGNTVQGVGSQVLGSGNTLKGDGASVVGTGSSANANDATVLGSNAHAGAHATGSVVLGSGSTTDRAHVVEVGGRQISGMADGIAATDGTNVRQLLQAKSEAIRTSESYADEGDARTLSAAQRYSDAGDLQVRDWAKSYADAGDARTLAQANAYTDWRFHQLDDRFGRTRAVGAAMAQMTASFAGADPHNRNRIGAGVGFAGGHNGLAVGYQHVSRTGHVAWNLGAAISGQERTLGAGVSYSW